MPMRAPNAAAAGVRSRCQRPLRSIVTRRRPHHFVISEKDERRPGRSTKALPGGGAAEAARRGSDDAETTHQQRQSSRGGGGGFSLGSGATAQRRTGGDWAAVRDSDVPGGKGLDMLAELGAAQDYNINVDHGQSAQFIDSLFVGKFLGTKADIASGELRNYEMRSFGNLVGDYYVAPKFLEAVTMHIAKNIMCDQGAFDNMRVPLILGIWGGKGQGKSFQTELAFKKLGVLPIIMSAGELENEWAGTPGDLIRERYKKAASIIKNQGKMSCLMINDLDAGIGRFTDTQCTVNNQMVFGTLMNICDDPNVVSTGDKWREEDRIPRVPIIVTGNDLSRLYAPLIRDGRMEKFYWRPTEEDRLNILHAMFKDDCLTMDDMATLLREFPNQSLDFFGAMRSGCYDHYIRGWLAAEIGQGEDMNDWGESHTKELRRRLIFKERLPDVETCDITMDQLLREGRRLVEEQEHVLRNKLSEEYFKDLVKEKETMARMEEVAARPPPPSPPPENNWRVDTTHILDREMAAARAAGTIEYLEVGLPGLEEEAEEEVDDSPWPRLDPDRAMALVKEEGYVFVDIRQPKDSERDRFQGSVSIPAVSVAGFGAGAAVAPVAEFVGNMLAKFSDLDSKLLLCGGSAAGVAGAEETEAIAQLQAAGYANLAEVRGGYPEWSRLFRHNGERRWTFSSMQHLGDSHSLHM